MQLYTDYYTDYYPVSITMYESNNSNNKSNSNNIDNDNNNNNYKNMSIYKVEKNIITPFVEF